MQRANDATDADEVLLKRKHRFMQLQNFKILLAFCEKETGNFCTCNYFRPWRIHAINNYNNKSGHGETIRHERYLESSSLPSQALG